MAQEQVAPSEGPIRVDLEQVESWKQVAHIAVDAAHVEKIRDRVARKLAKKAHIDGFRKGKVPASLIRTRYPGQVEEEALESLVPEVYQKVLQDHEELHPVAEPRVENLDLPEPGTEGEVSFDLSIEVRPEIELSGLDEIEATRYLPPVTEDRIDQALAEFVDRHSHWHEKEGEGAAEGDAVMIDYCPLDAEGQPLEEEAEKDHPLLLGAEGVLPEFNAALVGMEAGESTEIEVHYPVDYPNEELRGTIRTLSVTVKEIRAQHSPELDDAFVTEHTPHSTVEELRAEVRKQLEAGARRESDRQLREQLVQGVLDRNPIPVLPSLEARYLQAMISDATRSAGEITDEQRQQLVEGYRPVAQRAVRRMIVLDTIRRTDEIEVSDEELDAKLAELAEEQGMELEDFRRAVTRAQNLDRLRSDLEEEKVFSRLEERAKITVREELPEAQDVQSEASAAAGADPDAEEQSKE
jgi:trigger factor